MPNSDDGEIPLRVTAVALCGSDLHWFNHSSIRDVALVQPMVLGHELAGVTEGVSAWR